MEEDDVRFSGIAVVQDDNSEDVLRNTKPHQNDLAKVLPEHILGVTSFTFDNAEDISLPEAVQVPFLKSINGIAFVQTIDGQFAVASSFDTDETLLQLPILSELTQSQYRIFELNDDSSLDFFKSFDTNFKPQYVSVYGDYLFFSKSAEILAFVVGDVERKNVLSANKTYGVLEKNLASNASLTRISNLYTNTDFGKKYPKIATNYRWAAFQPYCFRLRFNP